ncbi:MAG TPA: hypothetical protein VGO65_07915 [Pseudolysinimonas sp.]|nr:hypothetical protein [Pseudolysinimonas sp.]
MKRPLRWGLVGAALVALALPIAGGALAFAAPASPVSSAPAAVALTQPPPPVSKFNPVTETPTVKPPASVSPTIDRRAAVPVPAGPAGCTTAAGGTLGSAPGITSAGGVAGTTTGDLVSFAQAYNAKRAANCLKPISLSNFRYDSCMERRLFWMAEDPSTNPASAWGHIGTQRSDGVPSVGCDGNLAGGMNNTGATVALKWWDSTSHRTALYKPTYSGSTSNVCIYFAMTHGGVPSEPFAFVRAAARWSSC